MRRAVLHKVRPYSGCYRAAILHSSFNNHKTSPWQASNPCRHFTLAFLYAPWVGIIGGQFAFITWLICKEGVFAFRQEGCVESESLGIVLAVDSSDIPCFSALTCHYHPLTGITTEQSGLILCGGHGRHKVLHLLGLHKIALGLICPMQHR